AIETLSPGQTAGWTFTATASSVGTYVVQLSAVGQFASGSTVSNTLNYSVPVTLGPASGGGGGGGGAPAGSTDLQADRLGEHRFTGSRLGVLVQVPRQKRRQGR